jgi:hypothetical protein
MICCVSSQFSLCFFACGLNELVNGNGGLPPGGLNRGCSVLNCLFVGTEGFFCCATMGILGMIDPFEIDLVGLIVLSTL